MQEKYFDKLNVKKTTKSFWKICKPYFSNKHSHGDSKITLIKIDKTVSENHKMAKNTVKCTLQISAHNTAQSFGQFTN